jgi:hypothetical protein
MVSQSWMLVFIVPVIICAWSELDAGSLSLSQVSAVLRILCRACFRSYRSLTDPDPNPGVFSGLWPLFL